MKGNRAKIVVLSVRGGALVGKTSHSSRGGGASPAEALGAFLRRYYGGERLIPAEILLPEAVAGRAAIEEALSEAVGRRVRIIVPRRGRKRRLVEMAEKNAALLLQEEEAAKRDLLGALSDIRRRCRFRRLPLRIECFDVSNIAGTGAFTIPAMKRMGLPVKFFTSRRKENLYSTPVFGIRLAGNQAILFHLSHADTYCGSGKMQSIRHLLNAAPWRYGDIFQQSQMRWGNLRPFQGWCIRAKSSQTGSQV
jgi:hypothetical protein